MERSTATATAGTHVAVRWVHAPHPVDGPRVVHVNTSARGGGVAEILADLVALRSDAAVPHAWAVVDGPTPFFAFTKTLHHRFHGHATPDPALGTAIYREVLQEAADHLATMLREDDVVVLHDPQTLGLAAHLRGRVRRVAWYCHVGTPEDPDGVKDALWDFFRDDLRAVDHVVVTDPAYVDPAVRDRVRTVHPAISPDAPKNRLLDDAAVRRTLQELGLHRDGSSTSTAGRTWQRRPLPDSAQVVLQVSRWDPLKGMEDVLALAPSLPADAHVVLAGPDPAQVLDDPEGLARLDGVLAALEALAPADRDRVHVLALSIEDRAANGLRVNALQRRADVVVQRSLQEGFGLTVTEAMHKSRAVVAHDVGGLRVQVVEGVTGHLVPPGDDERFAARVRDLLRSPDLRARLGEHARDRVERHFLMARLARDVDALAEREDTR